MSSPYFWGEISNTEGYFYNKHLFIDNFDTENDTFAWMLNLQEWHPGKVNNLVHMKKTASLSSEYSRERSYSVFGMF